MTTIKKKPLDILLESEEQISPGLSQCVGCNVELALRTCMRVLGDNTILAIPPGCMGGTGVVGSNLQAGAKIPVFFPLLDNPASMLAGIRLHYKHVGRDDVHVVAFAGDGATVDAGFQALSGAAERGDNIIYICYDNEGYMNTGYQRSGSTSKSAWTSTTPVSQDGIGGKAQNKKDFPMIMAMHDLPYMATANPAYIPDLVNKIEKAKQVKDGLAYIHIYNPCLTGWGIPAAKSIEKSREAVMSNFAPLYEVENGKFKINVKPQNPLSVKEYISGMKKFAHLTEEDIENLQKVTDQKWKRLLQLEAIED